MKIYRKGKLSFELEDFVILLTMVLVMFTSITLYGMYLGLIK